VPSITTLSDDAAVRRVVVEGEVIDPDHGSELYAAICREVKHHAKTVEVDLAGVDLFGSIGINALLKGRHEAEILGCLVTVVAASELVRRIFQITDLTGLLGLPQG